MLGLSPARWSLFSACSGDAACLVPGFLAGILLPSVALWLFG
jgi:hypothetical protein